MIHRFINDKQEVILSHGTIKPEIQDHIFFREMLCLAHWKLNDFVLSMQYKELFLFRLFSQYVIQDRGVYKSEIYRAQSKLDFRLYVNQTPFYHSSVYIVDSCSQITIEK